MQPPLYKKDYKKPHPAQRGALVLVLFLSEVGRTLNEKSSRWTSNLVAILPRIRSQSDFRFFTAASSVGSYKGVREDHPAEGRFEESTTASRFGLRQEAWIDPARKAI